MESRRLPTMWYLLMLPACCFMNTLLIGLMTSLHWCACGAQNLAAWGVAGTIVYYLWVKPEQKAEAERRVCSRAAVLLLLRLSSTLLLCAFVVVLPAVCNAWLYLRMPVVAGLRTVSTHVEHRVLHGIQGSCYECLH